MSRLDSRPGKVFGKSILRPHAQYHMAERGGLQICLVGLESPVEPDASKWGIERIVLNERF